MYLKHEKNLLITVCSGALRERYGRVTPPFLAGVLQKVKRQNLLITVCRRALRERYGRVTPPFLAGVL